MKTATQIASILFILSPSVTLAQQPDFTGTWERNDRLSQDPFEKIDIAMGAGDASAGTNTYNAVNRGTLLRDRDGATQRRLLLDYVEVLEVIEIEHAEASSNSQSEKATSSSASSISTASRTRGSSRMESG